MQRLKTLAQQNDGASISRKRNVHTLLNVWLPSVAAIATVALLSSSPVLSQFLDANAEPERDNFLSSVESSGTQSYFEEDFDPFSGQMILRFTPVQLKGKGQLDLQPHFYYSTEIWNRTDLTLQTHVASIDTTDHLGGGGWQLHMGKVINPGGTGSTIPSQPDNPLLIMPDGSTRLFFARQGQSGLISSDRWLWEFDASLPGWNLTDTEGTIYEFPGLPAASTATSMRGDLIAQATKITDVHGNTITISYNAPGLISEITETYGRKVTFEYHPSSDRIKFLRVMDGTTELQKWEFKFNSSPQLSWTHPSGTRSIYRLDEVVPPEGDPWEFEYYSSGTSLDNGRYYLKKLTYPTGGTIEYTFDGEDFEVGCQSQTTIEKPTLVTRKTGGRGITAGTWSYSYTDPGEDGAETTVSGPNNYSATHVLEGFPSYTPTDTTLFKVGRPASRSTSAGGETVEELFTWEEGDTLSPDYRLSSVWDNCGASRQLSPIKFTKPTSITRTVSRGNWDWTTTQSDFDAYGNPETISETSDDGLSRTTDLEYWYSTTKNILSGRVALRNEQPGDLVRNFYTDEGLLEETILNPSSPTQTNGISTEFTYDTTGRLIEEFVENGSDDRKIEYTLYSYGFPERDVIHKDLSDIWVNRDITPSGYVNWEEDGRRGTAYRTSYEYDDLGRVTKVTPPQGYLTSVSYTDDLSTVTATRGSGGDQYQTQYSFDGFGRLTNWKDLQTNDETVLSYNALGSKTQEQFKVGGLLADRHEFDLLGRLTSVNHPDSTSITYTYAGSTVTVTDEKNIETDLEYEAFGDPRDRRLEKATDANSKEWRYTYHTAYNLLEKIDAPGSYGTREFFYTTKRFLDYEDHPESGTTDYGYSPAGDRTGVNTEAESNVVHDYDKVGRLIGIDPTGTTDDVDLEYNDASLPVEVSNTAALIDMEWDGAQRLTYRDITVGGTTYELDFTYDGHDRLETITYPSGRTATYVYNTAGRVTSVTAPAGEASYISSVSYETHGGIDTISYGNGVTTSFTYDTRYRPTFLDTPNEDLDIDYDDASHIDSWITGGVSRTFAYDDLGRLEAATGPGGESISFTYDDLGNRSTRTTATGTETYNYDNSRQRLTSVTGTRPESYGYDDSGRLTSEGSFIFAYTPLNRVKSATASGSTSSFEYDGDGLRVSRVAADSAIYYIRDNSGNILAEVDYDTGDILYEHVYLDGQRIVSVDTATGERHYLQPDVLGSNWQVTKDDGTLSRVNAYFPFGKTLFPPPVALARWQSPGSNIFSDGFESGDTSAWSCDTEQGTCDDTSESSPFLPKFTGKDLDRDTGHYYFDARYQDPLSGRFTSPDPGPLTLERPQGLNRYSYALNSPYKYVDPTGETAVQFVLRFATADAVIPEPTDALILPKIGGYALAIAGAAVIDHLVFRQGDGKSGQEVETGSEDSRDKAASKTDRKLNPDRKEASQNTIEQLKKARAEARTKAEKKELTRKIKHEQRKQRKSEAHSRRGQQKERR